MKIALVTGEFEFEFEFEFFYFFFLLTVPGTVDKGHGLVGACAGSFACVRFVRLSSTRTIVVVGRHDGTCFDPSPSFIVCFCKRHRNKRFTSVCLPVYRNVSKTTSKKRERLPDSGFVVAPRAR